MLLNSLKLIICLYVSDWHLLEVKHSLSHTQISIEFSRRVSQPFLYGSTHPRNFHF